MPPLSYRAVLRFDAVGELLVAAALARLGGRMLGLVLVLYALQRFHSPALAGWIGFAMLAPGLAVSPLAGALLDRAGPARGIAIDMACGATCVLVLALLATAGAGSGVAGGLGALIAGHYDAPGREQPMMMAGMLVTGLAIWPVAACFGLPGLALGLVLVGLLGGPIDVGVLTLRQRRTDPAWLGRVMAVSISLNMSGAPIGLALGGALLSRSVPAAFAVAGAACLLGAAAIGRVPPQA